MNKQSIDDLIGILILLGATAAASMIPNPDARMLLVTIFGLTTIATIITFIFQGALKHE